MPMADTLTPESRFMALFVGPKHSGKTVAACSWMDASKKGNIKVLDGDGRIRGILATPWVQKSRIEYDYYPPEKVNGKNFFQRVNDDCDFFLDQMRKDRTLFQTYIADSATAFCKNLILDSIPLTHEKGAGIKIGTLEMAGPRDFGFESTGFDQYLSFLRSLPCNVIVTAHVVDKFDKPVGDDGKKNQYAENIIVGEKISLRDKIAVNSTIYFDHVFRFDRKMVRNEERFFVEYISDIACTSFPNLKPGRYDITGQSFYEFTMKLLGASGK